MCVEDVIKIQNVLISQCSSKYACIYWYISFSLLCMGSKMREQNINFVKEQYLDTVLLNVSIKICITVLILQGFIFEEPIKTLVLSISSCADKSSRSNIYK